MEKVLNFLKDAEVFFLSTINGDKPSCRPFGATLIFDNKLYLITKKHKNVSQQIAKNNQICITAVNKDYSWIRIESKLIDDSNNTDAKQAFLDTFEDLAEEGYSLKNPDFQILHLENSIATIKDYDGNIISKYTF